jgi:hypothetical protein
MELPGARDEALAAMRHVITVLVAVVSAFAATAIVWLIALFWGEVNLDHVLGYMALAWCCGLVTGGVFTWRAGKRRTARESPGAGS